MNVLNKSIINYNDKLAHMLVENFSFNYLSSATINRMEGQTKLYEKLESFVLLRKEYNKSNIFNMIMFLPKLFISYLILLITSLILRVFFLRLNKRYFYVIRTYFDERSITNGYLGDMYFGKLVDDLKVRGSLLIIYKLLKRTDIIKFIRTKQKGFMGVPIERLLNPISITRAYYLFIRSHIKLKEPFIYKGIDCTNILQSSLDDDYFLYRGLVVFLEKEIATKVMYLNPINFLYPFENQTWEKVYPYIKRKLHSDSFITGYQHTGTSFKILNYFPSRLEKRLPIFPDRIVTVGNIMKSILIENGNYPCNIVVGGALRFNKYFSEDGLIHITCVNKTIHRKIAYAFSYDIDKYNEAIDMLVDIFEDTPIEILLKIHPLHDEGAVMKAYNKRLPNNIKWSNSLSWDYIYNNVDLILYEDNSISIEGMIRGLHTFSVTENEQIYDISRKFYFSGYPESLNKDGIISLREQLRNNSYNKALNNDVQSYINEYFMCYDSKTMSSIFLGNKKVLECITCHQLRIIDLLDYINKIRLK